MAGEGSPERKQNRRDQRGKTGLSRSDDLARRAAASPGVINLGGGLPTETLFPRARLAASFVRALKASGAPALQYGWVEGQEPLRRLVAERLVARGARVQADDVIITNGAQQAISIAVQMVTRAGDSIGVQPASYPAALDLFRARKLTLSALEEGRASYVMPALGNPDGRALSAETRAALLSSRRPIIEDDAYGELRFSPAPGPPLVLSEHPARTYHVGTFSKTLCPGLRVGWLVVPPRRRAQALRIKQNDDLQSNSLSQAVLADYVAHNDFDARLVALRRLYRRRAQRLAEAVQKALPGWRFNFPEGGFCLWIETDAAVNEQRFLELALAEGVSVDGGSAFHAHPVAHRATYLRLCFSFEAPGRFREGAARLARAWKRAQRRTSGK
jgi:2-aminoadipate transaminase